jgi:hypothetical protein
MGRLSGFFTGILAGISIESVAVISKTASRSVMYRDEERATGRTAAITDQPKLLRELSEFDAVVSVDAVSVEADEFLGNRETAVTRIVPLDILAMGTKKRFGEPRVHPNR